MRKEHDQKAKEFEFRMREQVDSLTQQKNQYMEQLTKTREKLADVESKEREQSIKIQRLEQDLGRSISEADHYRKDNNELSEMRLQNEKKLTQQACTIERLESEIRDKMTIINSSTQLKETSNSQIKSLEEQTVDQKKQISKLESKVSELEGEVSRLSTSNMELQEKNLRQKEKSH